MGTKNKDIFEFTDIQEKKRYEFYRQDLRMVGAISVPDETGKCSTVYVVGFKHNSNQFTVDKKTFKTALSSIERHGRKNDQ